MSSKSEKQVWTRLTETEERAFNMKCAALGIKRPAAFQQAIEQWLHGKFPFACQYCRAEYSISIADPTHPVIEKAPVPTTSTPSEVPQVNPGIQWMLDELVLLLQDPDEKSTIRMLSGYLAERRQSRGE